MVYVGATVQDKLKVDSNISAQAEKMEQDLSGIRRALRKPLEAEVAKGELTLPQGAVMREVVRNHGISRVHPERLLHYSASLRSASRYLCMTRSVDSNLRMNWSS